MVVVMDRTLLSYALSVVLSVVVAQPSVVSANDNVEALSQDPDNWTMWGRTYDGSRYSPLDQINKDNVGSLEVARTFSTGVLRGHEGSPLVIGDTMYVHTPFPNKVSSINLADGSINWTYEPKQDAATTKLAQCCDTAYRGLAYADGKIILQQVDTTLVALDADTKEEIWSKVTGDPRSHSTNTNAPLVVGDKVYTGISGASGVPGFLAARKIDDGSLVWNAYSSGSYKEMLIDPDKTTSMGKPVREDLNLETWNGDQWKIGGGITWGWYTYDPELNLIYYGIENPSTWNPIVRRGDNNPADNKWSMTIFARDADTGMAQWVYQMTPHDEWDYDGVSETILADIEIGGEMRKVMVHFDRNGIRLHAGPRDRRAAGGGEVRPGSELGDPYRHGNRPAVGRRAVQHALAR